MKKTVTFFGNFGTQNLGNEYTLQAILQNVRKVLPEAAFNCVCTDPPPSIGAESCAPRASPPTLAVRCMSSKVSWGSS